jgi:transposase
MLYAGLDCSRHRLEVHLMDQAGQPVQVTTAPPDADGLRGLVRQTARFDQPVMAAIESMNGARFVHDQLELGGWEVQIADAQKVKGLAPLACKTDRIDAWVLAELARRDLVPAIWLPTPAVRAERERARWRLHLVRHRVALKNRVHATLLAFGRPCRTSDLFGPGGRALLARLGLPEPWAGTTAAAVALIDDLDAQIGGCERELRRLGADHAYVPLLMSAPGIAWVLGTRSPPSSATSAASPRPRSWSATPGCARGSTSPVVGITAGRWPATAPPTCGGPWSRLPSTPPTILAIVATTSAPRLAWAPSAVPRSPGWRSPASSPRSSGTCSPSRSRSRRQGPRTLWSLDDPRLRWPAGRSHSTCSSQPRRR